MSAAERTEVEQLLFLEARCLDDARRWDEWLALYTDDATYWIPYHRDQPDPVRHASIMYEDKALMEVRIRKLRHPRSWSQQPPSRTARVVGNVMIDGADADTGELIVHSSFNMLEFRNDSHQAYGGEYTHRLARHGGGFKIRHKRIDLISADGIYERLIQVPI
jgi:benzoate/toluate 1,2-dioxygenase beta subunit